MLTLLSLLKTRNDDIVKAINSIMVTLSSYLVGDDAISELKQRVEKKFED